MARRVTAEIDLQPLPVRHPTARPGELLAGFEHTGDFFSTKQERNPWGQVDLGANYALSEVRVTNRTDCCSERAGTLQVQLSTDGGSWQTVYSHGRQRLGPMASR